LLAVIQSPSLIVGRTGIRGVKRQLASWNGLPAACHVFAACLAVTWRQW